MLKKIIISAMLITNISTYIQDESVTDLDDLGEHATVTDAQLFPFMAAILKKSRYMSAGALIDKSWILTAAEPLYLLRESSRMIRIRLGSVNNKNGGYLTPIKFFEIHPNYDARKPLFDVALIKLPEPVRLTLTINPIRLQQRPRNVVATHFIVTTWRNIIWNQINNLQDSTDVKRRLLTVSHLHPTDLEQCSEELDMMVPDHNNTKAIMCLDPGVGSDPCQKEIGAPVVLNGILWGIISSWKSEDCDVIGGLTFVTVVSAVDVSTWIHSTLHTRRWNKNHVVVEYDDDNYFK